MQFIRVAAGVKLKPTGFGVGFAVGQARCHAVAFMQLVQQHETAFLLLDIVIDPILLGFMGPRLKRIKSSARGSCSDRNLAGSPGIPPNQELQ